MSHHDRENPKAAAAAKAVPVPKAAAYVVTKLRELDIVLVDTSPRLLDTTHSAESDDEAVHDLRVAIRRMRTLLKMSRGLFGRWHTDVVREAFAEVMRATGELRDEEVLEETLTGAAEGPEYDAWLRQRKTREQKLRRNVILRIERGDLDRARLMLKALLVFPVEPDRNIDLSRFSRRTVERARRKVEGKRDVEVSDVIGMHDLRIAYKELRYSIELLSDALPIDARAQLEPATVFQKRLGELHDVDVATEVIQKAKNLSLTARTKALQSLATLREKRVAKYLRELDPLGAASVAAKNGVNGSSSAEKQNGHAEKAAQEPKAPLENAPRSEPLETRSHSVEDEPTIHIQRADQWRPKQRS